MTKEDLVNHLFNSSVTYKMSKRNVKKVVDEVFNLMTECFMKGEDVSVRGFGHFRVRYREPHKMIHPGEQRTVMMTHPKYQVAFKTARNIKRRLRNPATPVPQV